MVQKHTSKRSVWFIYVILGVVAAIGIAMACSSPLTPRGSESKPGTPTTSIGPSDCSVTCPT